jgi:anti-sigma factor ChrR (cupin superfamily)
MGTNVTLGVATGATVAAAAEVAAGLEIGWAVAGSALADGAAPDRAAVDDVLALQADSASPTPRPSTVMLTILVVRLKSRTLVITSP